MTVGDPILALAAANLLTLITVVWRGGVIITKLQHSSAQHDRDIERLTGHHEKHYHDHTSVRERLATLEAHRTR